MLACLPLPLCACGADGEQQHGQWFGLDPEELLAFNHAEEAAAVAAAMKKEDEKEGGDVAAAAARWVTADFKSGDIGTSADII